MEADTCMHTLALQRWPCLLFPRSKHITVFEHRSHVCVHVCFVWSVSQNTFALSHTHAPNTQRSYSIIHEGQGVHIPARAHIHEPNTHTHIYTNKFSLCLWRCVSQYTQAYAHTNTNKNNSTHIGNTCKVLANRRVFRILF